jgi:hypothetical protein
MFDQLSDEILASLIKGFPRTRTTTTTKQNVDPAVYYVYSRIKIISISKLFTTMKNNLKIWWGIM